MLVTIIRLHGLAIQLADKLSEISPVTVCHVGCLAGGMCGESMVCI